MLATFLCWRENKRAGIEGVLSALQRERQESPRCSNIQAWDEHVIVL